MYHLLSTFWPIVAKHDIEIAIFSSIFLGFLLLHGTNSSQKFHAECINLFSMVGCYPFLPS